MNYTAKRKRGMKKTMNIYIDIHNMIGADGKAMAYCPEVHWTIDDYDSVSPEKMDAMSKELQAMLEKNFKQI